jgi:type I restriction enzyme R subunit
MDPALLYDPPFTDIAPTGPDDLFGDERVTRRFAKIETI